jgi:hypothetical protein
MGGMQPQQQQQPPYMQQQLTSGSTTTGGGMMPIPQIQNLDGVQVSVASSAIQGRETVVFQIFVRNMQSGESWRIEKTYNDLTALEARLKVSVNRVVLAKIGKAPEKAILTSLNPAKSEQRKVALELYLQRIIEVLKDSRDVIEFLTSNLAGMGTPGNAPVTSSPVASPGVSSANGSMASSSGMGSRQGSIRPVTDLPQIPPGAQNSPVAPGVPLSNAVGSSHGSGELAESGHGHGGQVLKEGYLVKKGKSFGGWKSRFFSCRHGLLEYYEAEVSKFNWVM